MKICLRLVVVLLFVMFTLSISSANVAISRKFLEKPSERDAGTPLLKDGIEKSFEQQIKLVAHDRGDGDSFGGRVAIYGDTALVGAYGDDVSLNGNQGSVYIYTRNENSWTLQAKLLASDGAAMDYFGNSVALSESTALIGAPGADIGENADQGAVYVYIRKGDVWTQQAKLVATDGGAYDYFGNSVSVSNELALVGTTGDDIEANFNQGSAYVFARIGSKWMQREKLVAPDGEEGDQFGYSVALYDETALISACFDDTGAKVNQGSAYVYVRSSGLWVQQAKLVAVDGMAEDYFGNRIALGVDKAVISASFDDIGANFDQGSAYVFARSDGDWTQQAKLLAADGEGNDLFGTAVDLFGTTIVLGSQYDRIGTNYDQGSVYFYTESRGNWRQAAKLQVPDGREGDRFGISVALTHDTVLVGSEEDIDRGAAYVYANRRSMLFADSFEMP
jgi:virulence-associated protein VapD